MSRFQKFAAGAAKKSPRCARFFETALRAILLGFDLLLLLETVV